MSNNTITICGNVVRDPEIRYTANGTVTTSFGVAVNRRTPAADGTFNETVSFFHVVAWRQLAENACESLRKGQRIVVTGRFDQRSWETEAEGKRSTFELIAEDIGASLKFATATITRPHREAPELTGNESYQVKVPDSPAELMSNAGSADEQPF